MPPKRIPKARSYPRARHESSSEDEDEELNELFRQAYASNESSNKKSIIDKQNNTQNNKQSNDDLNCKHIETIKENNLILCINCGLQLSSVDEELDHKLDSIQFKKCPDKGIAKDLEIYNLHPDVIRIADRYYTSVTNGDIKRSNLRKGIMFACVFQAYKELGKPQTPDHLQKIFGITRKNVSKGLTYFCLGIPNRNTEHYITAEHFIPKVIDEILNLKTELIEGCLELFKQIENKSSLLNRSNPQSVSKGVVFYYLRKINSNFDLNSYSEKVNLSATTILRICNTIDTILTPT
jgi:hypothetical protein